MWQTINQVLKQIDDLVWGVSLIVLISAGGVLLTTRPGLLQIRRLPLALQWMVKDEENGEGGVTSFGALCTALSATIGTGNTVGMATTVTTGGPGALFWMESAAFLGMATKYAEGLLAVEYRVVDDSSHVLGGPFHYIERGIGANWKWLARIFAFFGVCVGLFGIGTLSQVNGVSLAVNHFFDPNQSWTVTIPGIGTYSWTVIIASLILSVCVALALIGGIKRIANVSQMIVPFMAVVYILLSVALLLCNLSAIPQAAVTTATGTFNLFAVTGGIVGTMIIFMQKGIAGGIFSNKAGLGSAPIAAAAARAKESVRQGLASMTGTFIDTIVICTMTGLSIVLTGARQVEGLAGVTITNYASNSGLPLPAIVSPFLLMLCLVLFASTTILGWDYYSERRLEYLTGGNMKMVKAYRWLYIFVVFIGPYVVVKAMWITANILNGLMVLPNMIALFTLSDVVTDEAKRFFQKDRVSRLTSLSRHSL